MKEACTIIKVRGKGIDMADIKTIDSVGVDVSDKWARSREELEKQPHLDQVSRQVSSAAESNVTTPAYLPQMQALLNTSSGYIPLSNIDAPEGFIAGKEIFTTQPCPKLGSDEKLQEQIERLKARVPDMPEGALPPDKETAEALKERNALTSTLNENLLLGKMLRDILANRERYLKG